MNVWIAELLKKHKKDVEKNNFKGIILECHPKAMQELMDVFYYADITIPNSYEKQYADICCYLSPKFDDFRLNHIEWAAEETNYEFFAAGLLDIINLNEMNAYLDRFNAMVTDAVYDHNGYCTLSVSIFN